MEITYLTKRTDLEKRGMFGVVRSISYSEDSFVFRLGNGISIIVPVLGGSMSELTDLQREQINLLAQILLEGKKTTLHLADGSDEDIDDDSVEED